MPLLMGNSDIPQPGTSFSELPTTVNHHQLSESITTTTTATTITNNNNNNRNGNHKYNDDNNGEFITMVTSNVAGSSDMSLRSFRPNEIDDDFVAQELASIPRKYEYYFMPNKSQVLFYLTDASLLRIRRAGAELQVTDSIDFPLFDIWEEANCAKSTMILESYGRTVLLVSESSTAGCISGSKSEPPLVVVNDWNGDLFGYFMPGDPFLIEDNDKQTIAKILVAESAYGRAAVWICVLEGSGQELARMEEYSTIYFAKNVGSFQLKLLTLAAFARLTVTEHVREQSCCGSFLSMLFRC